jgi:TonB family protein
MRLVAILSLLLAASALAAGRQMDAPAVSEVLRQAPPDPHALDFVELGLLRFCSSPSRHVLILSFAACDPNRGAFTAPRALSMPDPEYSEEGRRKHLDATVILWVVVGLDGLVHDVRVQKPVGHGFDEEAIKAVRTWQFRPAMKDGVPVTVQINVEVNFRMSK